MRSCGCERHDSKSHRGRAEYNFFHFSSTIARRSTTRSWIEPPSPDSMVTVSVPALAGSVGSSRTNTLVTGIMDFHFNTNPAFLGIRPTVAAGKRFDVMSGLDVMAQVGLDLPVGFGDRFAPFYNSGLNISLAPADNLRVFGEFASSVRDPFNDVVVSSYRFNTATFGIKFVARTGKNTDLAAYSSAASVYVQSNGSISKSSGTIDGDGQYVYLYTQSGGSITDSSVLATGAGSYATLLVYNTGLFSRA